ncbi:MAG: DUF167 domain-containing protein [Candidatus Peregrinibacteria bacterium]
MTPEELFLAHIKSQIPPFYIAVKVIPNAQKTVIKEQMADETWKILVAAPPEKGKANEVLKKFLGKITGMSLEIISGEGDRKKLVKFFCH